MKDSLTILFVTDSLGFCRDTPEKVSYDETYINLVKKQYPNHSIVHLGIGGARISDLLVQTNYYSALSPDLVFIQSGIVDCAPRALSKFEIEFINRIPLLGNLISRIVKKYSKKIRNIRNNTYTNPKEFKNYLQLFFTKFNTPNMYAVEIMASSEGYEKILPGISNKVGKYNNLIQAVFKEKTILSKDFNGEDLMSDYHHLNKKGHHKLFTKIVTIIEDYNS